MHLPETDTQFPITRFIAYQSRESASPHEHAVVFQWNVWPETSRELSGLLLQRQEKGTVSGIPSVVISFEAFVGDRQGQPGRARDEHNEHGSVFVYDSPDGHLRVSNLRHSK
jgi:hypothetical protein